MPTPVYPSGVEVRGNVKLVAVPGGLADREAPKLTEVNAAGSLDISCMVAGEGWKPAVDQPTATVKRRICSKADRDKFSAVKYTFPELLYANDPQAADGSDGVKAAETLVPSTTIDIIERLGKDSIDEDIAVGDFVNVWTVTLGRQIDDYDLGDESSEFMVRQALIAGGSGEPVRRVQVIA